MTATPRATAGAVRSAHVAYFLPPDWGRIARHAAPALERAAADAPAVRLLVLVPDATAALHLTRALSTLPSAAGRRLIAATSPARLQRLLGSGPADAVIGSAETLAAALGASVLKLDGVSQVVFAAADEMDAESEALSSVLAEVPREAARILTALVATPGVESLIERYLHRARRVVEDVAPAEGAAVAPTIRYLTVNGDPREALPGVLDELDAPSAAVLVPAESDVAPTRDALARIGYTGGALAHVTDGEVAANTSLVVTLGVPSATAWQLAVDAQPSQIVAIVAPRDLEALRLLSGASVPRPLADRASISRARAAEMRRRAELRAELADGMPSREVLALEPLLREYDGLEIAAAALRLLERTRAAQAEAVLAAEQRVRSQMREAQKEREAADREERPRGFGRGDRGDRGDRPRSFDRGERSDRGERPRSSDRGTRPARSVGERPRSGPSRDRSRDDKPRGGFRSGDKPRSPRPPRDRGNR